MIKIVICDDHPLLRSALANILQPKAQISVIAEYDDGKQLLEALKHNIHPDIILMDISMKEMNGFETTLSIKNYYPHLKVIGFSMFHSFESVQMMLQNGAVGFLSKSCDFTEIENAIMQIHQNGIYYNQYVTKQLYTKIKQNNNDTSFTKKEYELLPYLCSDASYKAIADEKNVAVKTIDRHKENICKKMNVKTRAGLTALAAKMGLIN